MATSASKLDNYKLETKFGEGYVVHTTYQWEFATRRRTVSTWKHGKKIGVGASGSVQLQKEKGGRLRAVKKLSQDSLPRTSFLQELHALAKLKDHDHLFVEFYGWYENRDDIFIAMEYIEYGDLSKYIKDTTARSQAKEITRQILEGLEILHEKGICHRDLKPQNVLVASLDPIWVKIADFGTSKRIKNTALRTRVGTQGYLAPELLGLLPRKFRLKEDAEFTYALDMWSLGCFVHEILTSQTPFLELDDGFLGTGESGLTKSGFEIDMDSLYKYCQGEIGFPVKILKNSQVEKEGIDFVKSLLIADPKGRLTAANALGSPWLADHRSTNDWCQNLEREFSSLGVELSLGDRERARLVKQKYKADIMRFLPATASARFGVLLQQAAAKGLNLAVLILIKSPSDESIGYTTARKIFEGAAEAGQLDTIKLLLDNKTDLDNHVDIRLDTQTILQWAVEAGHYDIVKLFLDKRVGINASINLLEAFRTAFRVGNITMMRLLLENKTDVITLVNQEVGRKALQAMAERGDLEMAKLLLRNGADARAGAGDGQTALQAAAENENIDMVKLLLGNRVGISAKKSWGDGNKALQMAVKRRDIEIFEILLQNGAKPSPKALPIAVARKDVKMVKLLLKSGAKLDLAVLRAAAGRGHINMVRLLLRRGDIGPGARGGWTALQVAALSGHLGMVKVLLGSGADVNAGAGTRHGRTALQVAAKGGHAKVVKLLLDNNAKINARASTEYGPTALQAAVREGHIEIVKLLLGRRAHVKAKSKDGRTALQIAIESGYIEITKLLLENRATPDTTALQTAIESEYIEITKLLLKNGATPNTKTLQTAVQSGHIEITKLLLENGATPGAAALQTAIKSECIEITKLLLESGAAPDTATLEVAIESGYIEIAKLLLENGVTPDITTLQAAIRSGDTKTAKLLLEGGVKTNPTMLLEAVQRVDIGMAKLFLDHGLDTEVKSRNNQTALQLAAEIGYIDMVQLLLDYKANASAEVPRYKNWTVLRMAIENGDTEMVKLLLESGATADPVTLQMAAGRGYTSIMKLLLDNGADVNTETSQNRCWTPLQVAAGSRDIEMVKLLLESGARPDPATLREAVRYGQADIVELLLGNGADVNTKPCPETIPTLLQVATQYGHLTTVKLLLENNADVNARSLYVEGQTALQVAIKFKRPEIQKVLVDAGASDASSWLSLATGFRNFTRSWGLVQAPN